MPQKLPMPEFDRAVPLVQAAQLVGMHPDTLRRAYRRRELEVVRMAANGARRDKMYVRLSALDRWLKRMTQPVSRIQGV